MTVDKVKHDLELLDEVIQKGFETLANIEEINPATAIAAIQLKHKITGGSHGGYTVYGIEEIKLREAARENAMVAVLLEFIPEEHQATVLDRMEQVTKEYYESIGLGGAYAQMEARDVIEDHTWRKGVSSESSFYYHIHNASDFLLFYQLLLYNNILALYQGMIIWQGLRSSVQE